MIYFAFVHTHLLYGIEIYANTSATYLSKLIVLNNKLLRILQHKHIKHVIVNCIKIILLCLCNYSMSIKFLYLCILMFTIGINYLLYFQLT